MQEEDPCKGKNFGMPTKKAFFAIRGNCTRARAHADVGLIAAIIISRAARSLEISQ